MNYYKQAWLISGVVNQNFFCYNVASGGTYFFKRRYKDKLN